MLWLPELQASQSLREGLLTKPRIPPQQMHSNPSKLPGGLLGVEFTLLSAGAWHDTIYCVH